MYIDGLAIGAATVLAVLYSKWTNTELAQCLSIGVCVGLVLDFLIKRISEAVSKHRA